MDSVDNVDIMAAMRRRGRRKPCKMLENNLVWGGKISTYFRKTPV